MSAITVSHLSRYYKVYKRPPGFLSSILSFFNRHYETVKAVDDISFTIDVGELVGFIGPNGAGKTTTLKCLSGLLYPSDGTISVLGQNPYKRKAEYLKNISLIMGQKNQLWWDLPAVETFRLNKEIYDIHDNEYKKTIEEMYELLNVGNLVNQPVRKLSLGQRMKMELIAALLHKPRVLFLDEPTIGLDVVMQKKMRDFISLYNKKYNSTVILTSHYMSDVKSLCKRVIIIDRGRILYDGSLDKLVDKFAVNKILTVDFTKPVDRKDVETLGTVKSCDNQRLVLLVKRNQAKDTVFRLLKKFPVEDLNIEDPQIEDIIRDVFEKNKKK